MSRDRCVLLLAVLACLLAAACGNGGAGGERLKGDADGDGKLTEADAALARKMARGILPRLDHVDVDEDGKVTEEDADWILAHLGPAGEVTPPDGESGGSTSNEAVGEGDAGNGTGAVGDAGSTADEDGEAITNGNGETVYRAYQPPPGGKIFRGLWSMCPPAWTADSGAIVMPGWNEFQIYMLGVSGGKSGPLIKTLPPAVSKLTSSSEKGMFRSRVEGTWAHADAYGKLGNMPVGREVRVPLSGGVAEDLGPPKPDTFRQSLPQDWDIAGISPDRTLVAVTGKGYNPLDGNQRNPTGIFRLPNTPLGDLTCMKAGSSRDVAFSPDGKLLACVVSDAKPNTKWPHRLYLVQMSDLTKKKRLLQFSGWAGGNLSFSPDSRLLAMQAEWDRPQKRRLPWQKIYVIPVP